MAAVHLHNALFTPASPQTVSFTSHSSVTTSSDMFSTGHSVNVQQAPMPYPKRKRAGPRRFRRSSRTLWLYATITLSFALLVWVTYCTVRYYVALRIYGGDTIRSRYAFGMGITSTISLLFLANNSLSTLWFSDGRLRRRLMPIFHLLTYLSSALVMGLAIINLTLVLRWRTPHSPADSGRSVHGRCNWDLDVIWSGTGGACDGHDAISFGNWLGAAIFRLVITAVILVAYHLSVHGYLAASQSHGSLPAMIFVGESNDGHTTFQSSTADDLRPYGSSEEPHMRESSQGTIRTVKPNYTHDVEPSLGPLSFTEAGQVLSRIEGSEDDEDDDQEEASAISSDSNHDLNEEDDGLQSPYLHHVSFPRNDSPEPLHSSEISPQSSHIDRRWYTGVDALPTNPPPSSFHGPTAPPSNDLRDFASAFRGLVSRISRETQEGMVLDIAPQPRDTVRVLGSCISRMSTIESMASREVSNSVRSPSRSDTVPSLASGSTPSSYPNSRNLSRNPTLNRGRDRDEVTELPLSISPDTTQYS